MTTVLDEANADPTFKERLLRDIAVWQADGLIAPATAATLRERYGLSQFGLGEVLRYLGIVGLIFVVCGILGLIGALANSALFGSVLLLAVGAAFGAAGVVYAHDRLGRYRWSSRIALTLAVILISGAIPLLLSAVKVNDSRVVFFAGWLVLPAIVYVAYRFHITFLLSIALIEFFHWVGSWTSMWGRSTYELDVQDPRLMAIAALAVIGIGVWHEQALSERTGRFYAAYEALGLVYLNLSLLILTIDAPTTATMPWVLLFTVVAVGQVLAGARLRNPLMLGFGVTFLFIDFFTRFFETFWSAWEKEVFFLAIGLVTFAVGALCEYVLRLNRSGR